MPRSVGWKTTATRRFRQFVSQQGQLECCDQGATDEAFNAERWFHTGDLGKMDEDGYFYIVDRVKDMIIRGGYNVYPREIEEVLMTHDDVSLASVIGVPHPQHGEEVKAYIVLKEG